MSKTYNRDRKIAGWVLSSPLLVFLAFFLIYPIYIGVKTSVSRDRLSEFQITPAGLDNFKELLAAPNFWQALRFTLMYAAAVTIMEVILGFSLAILFDRIFPGKKILFSLMLVPIMIAPSLMAVMFRLILNENIGVIPHILRSLGADFSIFDQRFIFYTLIILDVLEYTAFTFLLSYAALQNMPAEIYESASIDGASGHQILARIVIPILRPVLAIVFLLRFLDSIRTFDSVYILTGGGPGTTTQTIGIYIYKTAFIYGNFGLAAAASLLLVLMLSPFMPWIIKQFGLGKS